MKTYNVKLKGFVPVENENDVKETSYFLIKSNVSFSEANETRKKHGKNAFIVPFSTRLEMEQPERKLGRSNKMPYKHHTKSNKKVVLS